MHLREQRPRLVASVALHERAQGENGLPAARHRMPERLSRSVTRVLQAASTTPEPMGRPRAFLDAGSTKHSNRT